MTIIYNYRKVYYYKFLYLIPPRNNNIGVSDYAYTMYASRAGEEEKEE